METYAAKLWNKNADHWSENINQKRDQTREKFGLPAFLSFLGNVENKSLLDAGCGNGAISRLLALEGALVNGIDFSSEMINIAKKMEENENLNIQFTECSILNMSKVFSENHFEKLISYMVLCCCENIQEFFDEAYKVMKASGDMFVAIPHPCFNNRKNEWIKNSDSEIKGILLNQYFDETSYVRSWDFALNNEKEDSKKMDEVRYPWTLSTYLNALTKAGFELIRIAEPLPETMIAEEIPRLKRWQEHAACFLFIHGRKV